MTQFIPHHINATPDDFQGNNKKGRYVFLPGSDSRAALISENFNNLVIKKSERHHNLYLGSINSESGQVDVAAISSGMGGSSTEIIVNELILSGAHRFIRVGTAGSLQNDTINIGDVVTATGAIRDESVSQRYLPIEFPAIASAEIVNASILAAKKLNLQNFFHTGIVHTKDALFAREFFYGPFADQHKNYMSLIKQAGAVASEMESSVLFILATVYSSDKTFKKKFPNAHIIAGTILAIIGNETPFASQQQIDIANKRAIDIALETTRIMHAQFDSD